MKRLIIVLISILTINFFLPRMMPGDPFLDLSAEDGYSNIQYSNKEINELKAYYGLDEPLLDQFISYYKNIFKGDFGYSIYYKADVIDVILDRLPWTLLIVLSSLVLGAVIGIGFAIISVINRNRKFDKFIYGLMIVITEIPAFLIGVVFLFVFAAKLNWFPLSGGISPFLKPSFSFFYIFDLIRHALLPMLTMSIPSIGQFYILSRSSMITVISKDYIRTGYAKSLSKKRINYYYILKNSIAPIIARVFLTIGKLFGATILVENVFAYPGIGSLMKESVLKRDYPMIQSIFLLIALLVLIMNYLAEFINNKIDPRI